MKDEYSVIGVDKSFERVISEGITFEEALKVADETRNYFDKVSISLDYSMRNPSRNILVFSDCEMMINEVKKLLCDRPDELNEQLIFLGNFISGNKGFLSFMKYLMKLRDDGRKLVLVRGENEHNLLEAIHETNNFIGNQSKTTKLIEAIEKDLNYTLPELKIREPQYYKMLNDSYTYYEDDKHIFTSGGLNLDKYWRESAPEDLHITSDKFINQYNNTGKTIVFGNRSVVELNNSTFTKPWINKDTKKIAINGNVRDKGRLIAISIIEGDRYFIGIRHRDTRQKTYAYDIFEL